MQATLYVIKVTQPKYPPFLAIANGRNASLHAIACFDSKKSAERSIAYMKNKKIFDNAKIEPVEFTLVD